MFNVIICSNNYDEVKILYDHLERFSMHNNFQYRLFTYNNIEKIIENTCNHIDVLFMNINLEDKQSFENINKRLSEKLKYTQVIYVCELMNFMLKGYPLKDYKYILKPLKYQCIEDELNNILKERKVNVTYIMNEFKTTIDLFNLSNELSIKDIYYIKATGSSSIAVTKYSSITIPYDIEILENKLDKNIFIRCNNDYIINLKKISNIGKYYVVSKKDQILISEERFEKVKNKLKKILNLY